MPAVRIRAPSAWCERLWYLQDAWYTTLRREVYGAVTRPPPRAASGCARWERRN